MSLLTPAREVVREIVPHCVACHRQSGAPGIVLEMRRLGDGTSSLACVNPSECKRHWPTEDRKGH